MFTDIFWCQVWRTANELESGTELYARSNPMHESSGYATLTHPTSNPGQHSSAAPILLWGIESFMQFNINTDLNNLP